MINTNNRRCVSPSGPRWIPHTKASDAELCFLWSAPIIKRLSKHSRDWWFETLSPPLWRHRNVHARRYHHHKQQQQHKQKQLHHHHHRHHHHHHHSHSHHDNNNHHHHYHHHHHHHHHHHRRRRCRHHPHHPEQQSIIVIMTIIIIIAVILNINMSVVCNIIIGDIFMNIDLKLSTMNDVYNHINVLSIHAMLVWTKTYQRHFNGRRPAINFRVIVP